MTAKLILGLLAAAAVALGAPDLHAQGAADVYTIDELTTLPALESPEQAARVIQRSYPRRLQSRSIGGSVRLHFVILPDGSVDEETITVVATTIRQLGEAAKEAVKDLRFTPGKVNGEPVAVMIEFPVVYRTED